MTWFHRSRIAYKFQCDGFNATYCDKIKRRFKIKICAHLGILALIGKRVKGDDDSAIKEHLWFFDRAPDFYNFSILPTNNNDFNALKLP